ncbi:hypothetical protein HAX54_038510 [Datura stramonium]|uniref:Uncharacterized protein n=1 Tax=Datura stramonium TaxID=4076 RepID=A0ABS8VLD9_DATST|nr:hypothetical protein [Datura stramonium]
MNEVPIVLHGVRLGKILQVPTSGLDDFARDYDDDYLLTTKFTQERIKNVVRHILKGEMNLFHKLLFEFINKCVLPHTKRRHEGSLRDLVVMDSLDLNMLINFPSLMLKYMTYIVDPTPGPHDLAYDFHLLTVFTTFGVCWERIGLLPKRICLEIGASAYGKPLQRGKNRYSKTVTMVEGPP